MGVDGAAIFFFFGVPDFQVEGDTVDGWNPKANHLGCMKRNPINNGKNYLSTGAVFPIIYRVLAPSQVVSLGISEPSTVAVSIGGSRWILRGFFPIMGI